MPNLNDILNEKFEDKKRTEHDQEVIARLRVIRELKDLLDDPPKQMTDWEYGFISDVSSSYEAVASLSARQIETLHVLENKYLR